MKKSDADTIIRGLIPAMYALVSEKVLPRLKAIEERPPPEAIKGDAGKSVTVEEVVPAVLPALEAQLKAAVEALPIPKDGRTPSPDEIAATMELPIARALLDFERRAQTILQRAIADIPKPKDGLDGLGFDDLTVEHDGERAFTIKLERGDQVKSFEFCLPVVIDRGFWKEGLAVAKGDGLTFGGSYWIAQKDTDTKPDIGNSDWRLAVKKGRDGKSS